VAELQQDIAALRPAPESDEPDPVESLGKDFDEAIGIIKTSIERMDRLINAVLKLSREGRRQFTPEHVDMAEMLNALVETVAHRAAETGTHIEVSNIAPVESDRLALEQVFSNLIDNALKYGRRDDTGRIEIVGRETPTQVAYEVRDNGRGIDPKDHQRVFELFRRSGAQDRPGEGLGLAHVRALVRRLGGHIALSSELGKGSQFTVTLPRRWTQGRRSAA
jgi:signal transduction histidine kinase